MYSKSSIGATKSAYNHARILHDRPFASLRTEDLQAVIDNCDRKYADHVKINTPDDDEKGVPFMEQELDMLWEHSGGNEVLQAVLIMVYSGFRISVYNKLEINMEEQYFRGGVKTKAGKNRIVSFYREIVPFIDQENPLFHLSAVRFRTRFMEELSTIGITGHTPHDCRHTFSWLCDKYHVDTLSKKMLMGHALGNDITDLKYGHRTIEELRNEINKICR